MNIKVFCKICNWKGQAIVGKKGLELSKYECPKCGHSLKRCEGRYDYYSEKAVLK